MGALNDLEKIAVNAVGDVLASDSVRALSIMNNHRKWCWMMDWCKHRNIPPAQMWAWQTAQNAYIEWALRVNPLSAAIATANKTAPAPVLVAPRFTFW